MEDVRQTLDQHIEVFASEDQRGEFTQLSQRWASHSLQTYRDELLTKALAISRALADFDAELNDGATNA